MSKIQYQGLSDIRILAAGDTLNGAVPAGLPVQITFNAQNNWMIDTTQAPYTGVTGAMVTAITGLPHGEFIDVSSTPTTPTHVTIFGTSTGGTQQSPSHNVSTGATSSVTAGAAATSAAVGALGANDTAGTVTCVTEAAGNAADEVVAHVAFVTAYGAVPKHVDVRGTDAASVGVQPYAINKTVNGFDIACHVAPGASATLNFSYAVVG